MNKHAEEATYEAIIRRIHSASETRTQVELADFLGIRQSSISDAKRRKAIPKEWLVTLLRLRGINPEWVLTGEGARLLQPAKHSVAEAASSLFGYGNGPLEGYTAKELADELVRRISKNI